MDTYALHLGVAALVGASFMAVSAYYIHRETLNQLLEYFADTVEREKANEELGRGDSPPQQFKKYGEKRRGHGRRHRRVSDWLANDTVISGAVDGGEKRNGPVSLDRVGLPKRHRVPEGMQMSDFSPDDKHDLN